MDAELRSGSLYAYTQKQEQLFARLEPAGEFEESLVQQIAMCGYKLDQVENRLIKAWAQLNKMYEELKHEPLP